MPQTSSWQRSKQTTFSLYECTEQRTLLVWGLSLYGWSSGLQGWIQLLHYIQKTTFFRPWSSHGDQVMETRCTVMLPSIVSVLCHNFEKEHTKGSIVAWRRQSWPYGHRYTRATPRYRVFMPKNWRLWILIHSWSLHILAFNNVDVNRFQNWTVPKSKMRLHLPLLETPSPRP